MREGVLFGEVQGSLSHSSKEDEMARRKMTKKQREGLKKGRESPRAKALREALIKRRRIKRKRDTRTQT